MQNIQSSCARKIALITGIGGQIGSYLAPFLLEKGYEVHGISRSVESLQIRPYAHVYKAESLTLHYGALTHVRFVEEIIEKLRPDEVYNLGAQSVVADSWDLSQSTCETNFMGLLYLLDAVRKAGLEDKTRIFQACTSEMFGDTTDLPQREDTVFAPATPYATSKVAAYWLSRNYRKEYDMFVTNGIVFNHESPRRDPTSRTQKFANGIAKVKLGHELFLQIGNPETQRDWGHVSDLVQGMWLALQYQHADDFVFAAGNPHSIRDFLQIGFKLVGFNLRWEGDDDKERGVDARSGNVVVKIDPDSYGLPSHNQWGDSSKALKLLGWKPQNSFDDIVGEMVANAMSDLSQRSS